MLVAVIVIIFVIGLVLFIKNLPKLKNAAKEGWQEGKAKSKKP